MNARENSPPEIAHLHTQEADRFVAERVSGVCSGVFTGSRTVTLETRKNREFVFRIG